MITNDEIVRLREHLVAISKNNIETRSLLDKLTDEIQDETEKQAHFIIRDTEVQEKKDFEFYEIERTRWGFFLRYKSGYSIFIDHKLSSPYECVEMLMNGVPDEIVDEEERKNYEVAMTAIETIFRLPMFVFSHPATTYNIATMATQYLLLLQQMGDVPTEETDNPEFDKFISQMNDMLENFADGIRKEGLEYERRMGISNGEEEN